MEQEKQFPNTDNGIIPGMPLLFPLGGMGGFNFGMPPKVEFNFNINGFPYPNMISPFDFNSAIMSPFGFNPGLGIDKNANGMFGMNAGMPAINGGGMSPMDFNFHQVPNAFYGSPFNAPQLPFSPQNIGMGQPQFPQFPMLPGVINAPQANGFLQNQAKLQELLKQNPWMSPYLNPAMFQSQQMPQTPEEAPKPVKSEAEAPKPEAEAPKPEAEKPPKPEAEKPPKPKKESDDENLETRERTKQVSAQEIAEQKIKQAVNEERLDVNSPEYIQFLSDKSELIKSQEELEKREETLKSKGFDWNNDGGIYNPNNPNAKYRTFDGYFLPINRKHEKRVAVLQDDALDLVTKCEKFKEIIEQIKQEDAIGNKDEVKKLEKEKEELIEKTAQRHIPSLMEKKSWIYVLFHPKTWIQGRSRGFGLNNKTHLLFGLNYKDGSPVDGKGIPRNFQKKCKLTRTCAKFSAISNKQIAIDQDKKICVQPLDRQNRTISLPNGLSVNVDYAMKHMTGLFSEFHDFKFSKQGKGSNIYRGRHLRMSTKKLYYKKLQVNEAEDRLIAAQERLEQSSQLLIANLDGKDYQQSPIPEKETPSQPEKKADKEQQKKAQNLEQQLTRNR